MVDKILEILRNTNGIEDVIYNDKYRANFQLDKAQFPCAVVTIIPEISIDIKSYVHEKASVNVAVVTECPLDWEGVDVQSNLNDCKNALIAAIGELQKEFKMDTEIKLQTIIPAYDDNVCGFVADLAVQERQGRCMSSYVQDGRIFDKTFDKTFN